MNTRLGGNRSPGPARLFAPAMACLVVGVYAAGLFTNFWLNSRLGMHDQDPVDVMLFAGFGAFAVVGALLVAKRPTNLVGWIMAAVALMVGLFPAGDAYAGYVMATRGHPDALAVVGAWVQSWYWFVLMPLALIYLPLLFPDGRLPSRRWLPIAMLAGVGTLGPVVLGALTDTLSGQDFDYRIDNPIGIEGLSYVEALPVFGVLGILLLIGGAGAVASVVVRFRRSRGAERQQMKWFVYAAALILPLPALEYVPGPLSGVWLGLVLVALPTSIGIAVLRYRLYDIDVVINRTLVYGFLTATLVALYFGGIVVLQRLFVALTGEKSTLAVVASTLLIAALFSPLRRRIQGFIDRRFYRRKYDARKTLEAFSSKLRDETDLDRFSDHLTGVVREAIQPSHLSLWIRPDTLQKGERAD